MSDKYLNQSGLQYLWEKIRNFFPKQAVNENILYNGMPTHNGYGESWSVSKPAQCSYKFVNFDRLTITYPAGLTPTKYVEFRKYIRLDGSSALYGTKDLMVIRGGDTLTFSLDFRSNGPLTVYPRFTANFSDGRSSDNKYGSTLTLPASSEWKRYTWTIKAQDNFDLYKDDPACSRLDFSLVTCVTSAIYDGTTEITSDIRNIKLEFGDRATDYSLSHHDLFDLLRYEECDALPEEGNEHTVYLLPSELTAGMMTSYQMIEDPLITGISRVSVSLDPSDSDTLVSSKLQIVFYFESGANINDYQFSIDGDQVDPAVKSNAWVLKTDYLPASEYAEWHTFNITKGTESADYSACVLTYVYRALSNSSVTAEVIEMAKKLYRLWSGDYYDEFIWVNDRYERLGNRVPDLSGYALKSEIPDGGSEQAYATCSTTGNVQKKVASTVSGNYSPEEDMMITVYFTNAQTYNGTPTLNIDGSGAYNIQSRAGTNAVRYMWNAGTPITFVFKNNAYVMVDKSIATTSYYGVTKLSSAVNSTSTTLAATPSAVKQAYDLANSASTALTDLIKTKLYTKNFVQIPSYATYDPSANEMGFVTPDGYTPIGYRKISVSDDELTFSYIDINATQYDTALKVHNPTASMKNSVSVEIEIVYIKSSVISQT